MGRDKTRISEKSARYYARHKEDILEQRAAYAVLHKDRLVVEGRGRSAKYRAAHPEREAARNASWYASHKAVAAEAGWRRHLAKKYKITAEDYGAMLNRQGGVCLICGRPPKRYRLHVDHRHSDGKVRGLLCHHCNNLVVRTLECYAERIPRALRYLNGELREPPKGMIGAE